MVWCAHKDDKRCISRAADFRAPCHSVLNEGKREAKAMRGVMCFRPGCVVQ